MMPIIALISLLFYYLNYTFASSFLPNFKPFHFDRIDGMARGVNNVPVRVSYIIIKQDKNVLYLNSTINVKEDVQEESLSVTKIYRCDSKEALDSCELYLTTQPIKYCNVVDSKMASLSPFYIEYVPEFKCPLKKGIYRAYKWKVDFTPYIVLPFGNSYWKTVTECRLPTTNKLIQMLKVEGYQPK